MRARAARGLDIACIGVLKATQHKKWQQGESETAGEWQQGESCCCCWRDETAGECAEFGVMAALVDGT